MSMQAYSSPRFSSPDFPSSLGGHTIHLLWPVNEAGKPGDEARLVPLHTAVHLHVPSPLEIQCK